jgi:hypothetical protein
MRPRWGLNPRLTDRLIVGRNVILTLTWYSSIIPSRRFIQFYLYTSMFFSYSIFSSFLISSFLILSRVRRLYKTGIGLTTGFITSHTVTHNYSVCTLQLTTTESLLLLWRPRLQPLQPTLMASLAITHYLITTCCCQRPSYIAREQTTKKTPSPIPLLLHDITGTDPKENNSSFHCCVA